MSELPPAKAAHILLIDDEESVLFALTLLLQALGFTVTGYCESQAALTYLAGGEVCDVCICDLHMPRMDGISVLREAKKARPSLPFVLMSGHATDDEYERARRGGALGFLAKPFQPDEVKELVSKCFLADTSSSG